MSTTYDKEFPCLQPLGLYAADIRGDGNCLFNALSDQLYGSQDKHYELRQRTIEYMKANKSYFAMFMDVLPGGATRRQPKRKTAGGYSSASFDYSTPTASDIENAFDVHLKRMAKGGTYGDNLEISAFSSCFEVDIQIFQSSHSYMVSGQGTKENRQTLHIAYHTWEHYSSIRNLDGPHYGLPVVQMKTATPAVLQQQQENIRRAPKVIPGQVKAVMSSLYFPVSEIEAMEVLEKHRGNVNNAADALMSRHGDKESPPPSSIQSSSVERELGSDEDFRTAPKKKQDRRLSRASTSVQRRNRERKHQEIASRLGTKCSNESLESLVNVKPAPPHRRRHRVIEDSDDESISPPPALDDGSTTPDSDYSIPTDYSSQSQGEPVKQPEKPAGKITIRLNQSNLSRPSDVLAQYSKGGISKLQKRPVPSRDLKDIKKQAQKAAAKERRRQAASPPPKTASASSSFTTKHGAAPVMSEFRVLHI